MNDPGAALAVAGIGAIGVTTWALTRPDPELVWRELRFPIGLETSQVEALLGVVAQSGRGPVILQVEADHHGVRFGLAATAGTCGLIEQALSGLVPQIRLTPLIGDERQRFTQSDGFDAGLRLGVVGPYPLLRDDQSELSVAALLGTLVGLGRKECLRLRLTLRPAVVPPPRPASKGHRSEVPTDHLRSVRIKYSQNLLHSQIVLAASAVNHARARQLVGRTGAVLAARAGLRGGVRRRSLSQAAVARALDLSRRFGRSGLPLTPSELVAFTGWPVGSPSLAGVPLGVGPSLPVDKRSSDGGSRVFAVSTFPAQQGQNVEQPVLGGLQHVAIIGGTGSGKSTLVSHLVKQDMQAGRGCLVVDAKGDLVDELLALVPGHRRRDVILLDPARGGPQPGLRLFPPHGRDIELSADLVANTLAEMWPESWGVRSRQYIRLGLVTLGYQPQATLVDLPHLLSDPGFRRAALRHVSDPLVLAAWQRFEALSPGEQVQHVTAPLTKLEELVARRRLRTVLGQVQPKLNMSEVLGNRRIVLVRLSPGALGAPAARLLSALVLWQFLAAVEGRAELAPAKRTPFFVYLDEVHSLSGIGLPLTDLLERARGLGVGLHLAPQALSQLPEAVQRALLANVGSLVAFRLSRDEAKTIGREMAGVEPEQLQHLDKHEVALRLAHGPGELSATMTGRTLPSGRATSDAEVVRTMAERNWGSDPEVIERSLVERLGLGSAVRASEPDDDDPIGVRRRRS